MGEAHLGFDLVLRTNWILIWWESQTHSSWQRGSKKERNVSFPLSHPSSFGVNFAINVTFLRANQNICADSREEEEHLWMCFINGNGTRNWIWQKTTTWLAIHVRQIWISNGVTLLIRDQYKIQWTEMEETWSSSTAINWLDLNPIEAHGNPCGHFFFLSYS